MSATEKLLSEILAELKKLNAATNRQASASSGLDVADDRELDSQHGDEAVKMKPRDWTGDFVKGLPMSHYPPEFLDELAKAYDWFAIKNKDDEKKSGYDKRSARRARGWAARLRSGWKPERPSSSMNHADDRPLGDESGFGHDDFGASGFNSDIPF